MVEWSNEMCLRLIGHYETYPELWDPKSSFYYSKTKKANAWEMIAKTMNMNIHAVRQKMFSLLGSFRSQKTRSKKLVGNGNDVREVYASKWFAFERMRFLLDKDESKDGMDADYIDVIKHEPLMLLKEEEYDNTTFTLNYDSQDYTSEDAIEKTNCSNDVMTEKGSGVSVLVPSKLPRKRKLSLENKIDEAFNIIRDAYKKHLVNSRIVRENDESGAYGEYVSSKLRTYSPRTRAVVQHAMNNIIFEADLGHYDEVDSGATGTGQSNASSGLYAIGINPIAVTINSEPILDSPMNQEESTAIEGIQRDS